MQSRDSYAGGVLHDTVQRDGDCIDVRQRGRGGVREGATLDGEDHAPCVALKQLHAQRRLQSTNMVADGTGGQPQLLGGIREVLMSRGDREHAKCGECGGAEQSGFRFAGATSQICG